LKTPKTIAPSKGPALDSSGAASIVDPPVIADTTLDEEQTSTETSAAEAATADKSESEADAAGPAWVVRGAQAPVVTVVTT
jgi:hypothetical protein